MTKLKYGIIGHPVKHSLSPAIQNAAFKASGIDAEYSLFDIEPAGLENFLGAAHSNGFSGFNITIPHKIKVKEYIEKHGSLDEVALRLGAVNTVMVEKDGNLRGYNTDGPGFYRSLLEDLKFEPEGRHVFVLGAGGAARAIIMYLGNAPARMYVSDIDKDKIKELLMYYGKYFDKNRLVAVDGDDLKSALAKSELFINATPVGMKESDPSPVAISLLPSGIRVYDLVYNRPMTRLVREANSAKLHAVTGIGLLLHQGAIAFEIWTGKKAPLAVMKKALRAALK